MKSITTKLIFGVALSIVGIATISPQAWAANRITPQADFEIQGNADPLNKTLKGVDPHFHKFNMNFSINGKVNEGDYFDIETHALPLMNGLDLKDSDNVVIGRMEVVQSLGSTRDHQSGLPVNWRDLALNGYGRKYRVTFNSNVANRTDIKFSVANLERVISATIADRDYDLESWVKINDIKAISKNHTIKAFSRNSIYRNAMWFDKTVLNADNGSLYLSVGLCMTDNNMTGGKVNLSLENNPYYKFIQQPYESKKYNSGSNFFFDETSSVNQYGAIFSNIGTRKWSYEEKIQNDKNIEFEITSKTDGNICSGLYPVYIELTDEGKRYFTANNKMPSIKYDAKMTRADSSQAFLGSLGGDVITLGTSAEFFSKIKEEVKQIEKKEKTPEAPKAEEPPKQEIKAPNTGFDGGISALALSILSLLGLATFLTRKR